MKVFFIALITALLMTSTAYAVPITFTDTTQFTPTGTIAPEDLQRYGGGTVNKLDGIGDFVTWTHFFTLVPPAAKLLDGSLTLSLRDNEADTWNIFSWELAVVLLEDGRWDFGEADTGKYQYDLNVFTLRDGEFGVMVASIWGDFYLLQSDLTVTYEPVPEPSTILLLGAGLLGLGIYARRRRPPAH